MKPLLFVLLAASLAANVVLGLRARSAGSSVAASSASSTAPSVNASASSPATAQVEAGRSAQGAIRGTPSDSAAAAIAAGSLDWRPHGSESDLRQLVEKLRTAGYPPSVVRAVVNQLLTERFAARQPQQGMPFWKQAAPTAEMVAAQSALSQERRALFETLLGADARPSAVLDESTRQRRYGNLSDAKIDAIDQIERDYSEMRSESWAKRRGNAVTDASVAMQSQQLMEQEKFADIAALLTPEELAEYEMRNSQSARTLMNNLRNVEVSEAEYARLYEAQKAFDAANPQQGRPDFALYSQRQAAQLTLHEQSRVVLGEERFYSYLETTDRNYANVVQALASYPSVSRETSYQVYQLQTELQSTMSSFSRNGPPPQEKIADIRATVESYNNRLESLIGAEAAEAYRKQGNGRMFTSFRGPATRTTGQPAGR